MHTSQRLSASVKAYFRSFSCRNLNFIVVMAAALASTACWAGRPLATEDAGVLGKGECEFESFAGRQAHSRLSFGSAQIGCGIGAGTQLAFGASREVAADADADYLTLSGKAAFQELTEEQVGIALAYTLLSERGQSDYLNYISAEIKGVITLPYQGWLLHANAGLVHVHTGHGNRTVWAIAAERPGAIGPLDLMGEVYGDNKSSPWMQLAARWAAIPGRLFFDGSYGVQTNGRHSRLLTLGMKVPF